MLQMKKRGRIIVHNGDDKHGLLLSSLVSAACDITLTAKRGRQQICTAGLTKNSKTAVQKSGFPTSQADTVGAPIYICPISTLNLFLFFIPSEGKTPCTTDKLSSALCLFCCTACLRLMNNHNRKTYVSLEDVEVDSAWTREIKLFVLFSDFDNNFNFYEIKRQLGCSGSSDFHVTCTQHPIVVLVKQT